MTTLLCTCGQKFDAAIVEGEIQIRCEWCLRIARANGDSSASRFLDVLKARKAS